MTNSYQFDDLLDIISQYASKEQPAPQASDDKTFRVHNGRTLWNLQDLRNALNEMTDVQFDHHVCGKKNDFATWVEQVLGDKDCAKRLRTCKTILSTKRVVIKCLRQYS